MFESIQYQVQSLRRRLHRLERREANSLRRWLEDTENLLHLSVLVVVPILMGTITWISNISPVISFLVYPPLASGTYTLFADPAGRYSSPRKFVGGMTMGAFSGWVALELTARLWYTVPPTQFQVHAGAAALGILFTGITTWLFDFEVPTAYSTSLLILVTGSEELTYVAGITVSSLLVAGAFILWREHFYHERAQYLFQSTNGDDQILVPFRDEASESVALLAARLASAHDAGKIVLMETVSPETIDDAETELPVDKPGEQTGGAGHLTTTDLEWTVEELLTQQLLDRLETLREQITATVDVPCEFVVAVEDTAPAETVLRTAADENCDLIVAPYETSDTGPSQFVRRILSGPVDTVVFRPSNGRTEWQRILVMVRSQGEIANAMLDFARRLLPTRGIVSACTCISQRRERRSAEIMLENLVDPFAEPVETRIADGTAEDFLDRNAENYDLAILGASSDRSIASRLISAPTYERIRELECDTAIVHRR